MSTRSLQRAFVAIALSVALGLANGDALGQDAFDKIRPKPGQTVLDQLREAEAAVRPTTTRVRRTPEEECDLVKNNGGRCRAQLLADGYKVAFRGYTGSAHGSYLEVLVRGDEGALCAEAPFEITDYTRCFPLKAAK